MKNAPENHDQPRLEQMQPPNPTEQLFLDGKNGIAVIDVGLTREEPFGCAAMA